MSSDLYQYFFFIMEHLYGLSSLLDAAQDVLFSLCEWHLLRVFNMPEILSERCEV